MQSDTKNYNIEENKLQKSSFPSKITEKIVNLLIAFPILHPIMAGIFSSLVTLTG